MDTTEEEPEVDINAVIKEIKELEAKEKENKEKVNEYLKELGFEEI